MPEIEKPEFHYEDHPDHPGWKRWGLKNSDRYNSFLGDMMVRVEDGTCRVRMLPERRHSNLGNNVHGGAMLGFIDVSLFAAARSFGLIAAGTAVTLDLNTHFMGAGRIDDMLEARVELLRETGRLLFMRGLVVQDDGPVAEFSGTIRKPTKR